MKLLELIKIDNRFEKSVNLTLDLYVQDMYEMLVVRPGTPDDEYGDQRINNILALLKDPMECSEIG